MHFVGNYSFIYFNLPNLNLVTTKTICWRSNFRLNYRESTAFIYFKLVAKFNIVSNLLDALHNDLFIFLNEDFRGPQIYLVMHYYYFIIWDTIVLNLSYKKLFGQICCSIFFPYSYYC